MTFAEASSPFTNDSIHKHLDITGANDVEVEIREDGTVLWINTEHGCKLRICSIRGNITIIDHRSPTP